MQIFCQGLFILPVILAATMTACGSGKFSSTDGADTNTDTDSKPHDDTGTSTVTVTDANTDTNTGSEIKYNVYFGMLHNHTNISDGTSSPSKAYQYARDNAKLDFFGIADHDYWPDDMTNEDWTNIKNAANSHNQDGTFVTFWGFEIGRAHV